MQVLLVIDHGQAPVRRTIDLRKVLKDTGVNRRDYCFFCEVGMARFWFDTPEAREAIEAALRRVDHTTYLTAQEMARHNIHFAEEDGFGDGYLVCDAGTALFPHDFYHPLVNAYMARKTSEQAPRRLSPVHRGNHGGLPGRHPSDTGFLMPLTGRFESPPADGRLIDVAPTLLSLLGQEIPAEMTGRPLLETVSKPPVPV